MKRKLIKYLTIVFSSFIIWFVAITITVIGYIYRHKEIYSSADFFGLSLILSSSFVIFCIFILLSIYSFLEEETEKKEMKQLQNQ
jgi:uncharacterized membrane protein